MFCFNAGLHGERNLKLPHGFEKSNDFSKVKGKKRENELPIGAFFSLGSYRGYSLQIFTFVFGISETEKLRSSDIKKLTFPFCKNVSFFLLSK